MTSIVVPVFVEIVAVVFAGGLIAQDAGCEWRSISYEDAEHTIHREGGILTLWNPE